MSLSSDEIKLIVDALQASDWDQATVVVGEVQISVARHGFSTELAPQIAAPVPREAAAVAPTAPAVLPPATESASATPPVAGHVITSPTVGVLWRSPEPGAAPFVEIGSRVAVGDTLAIVEIMKLMSNISADVAGEVVAVHVENAGAVEFGTPLFTIRGD